MEDNEFEKIKSMFNIINSKNSNSDTKSTNNAMDFETILKFKNIMDKMNSSNDDARTKLLVSLKPYLKESRKNKVDQYIQFLNMSKIFNMFSNR